VRINWNGRRRWIALALVVVSIYFMLTIPPVIPVIQLPGEVWPNREIFGLPITNTLVGSVIVWILIGLLIFYISRRRPQSGSEVPRGGFYNFFEMLYEGLYGFVEGIAGGPYMRTIFSFFMTIFLIVLLSNWTEMIPGVDSVGFLEPHVHVNEETGELEYEAGYETMQVLGGAYALNPKCPWVSPEAAAALTPDEQAARATAGCVTGTGAPVPPAEAVEAEAAAEGEEGAVVSEGQEGETAAEGEAVEREEAVAEAEAEEHHYAPGDPSVPWVVLPYVRVPSTDLNMTLGLALVAVVIIQVMGVRALGPGYFTKFFPIKKLITSPAGAMDLIIGLLEFIGEIARILSFSFRLLGNIFAGSILLFVVSFLIPAVIPWGLFLFEFFVGIIQALIFGLLTAIFMNTATIGHHAEEHGEAEAAH
jgi:F-type H+-transporting ATPase subunit a